MAPKSWIEWIFFYGKKLALLSLKYAKNMDPAAVRGAEVLTATTKKRSSTFF